MAKSFSKSGGKESFYNAIQSTEKVLTENGEHGIQEG